LGEPSPDPTRALGHSIVPTTPALAPLVLDEAESFHRDVSGVSQEVELAVWIDGAVAERLRGSILWTHFGASGPVAMNASRLWHRAALDGRRVALTVNFQAPLTFDDMDARLVAAAGESPRASVRSLLAPFLPASVSAAMLGRHALDPQTTAAHLPREDRRRLAHALVEWPLPVTGSRGYAFAEATAGGVPLDEVDPASLESKICPGVFFAGEILDVDGRIGGFNFQWAWSSARVVGRALARRRR
jgi:predicted Rossmann fold flavoprotein